MANKKQSVAAHKSDGTATGKPKAPRTAFKPGNPYRIKPGQVLNPGGRPKKTPLTEMYEELLASGALKPKIKAAVLKTILGGRMAMVLQLKEMAERVEGKVVQEVNAEINVSISDVLRKARERAAQK